MDPVARLGAALLRAPATKSVYRHLVLSHRPWTRCFGLSVLAVVYGLRTARQFSCRQLGVAALAALVLTQAAIFLLPTSPLALAAGCTTLAAAVALACVAGFQPEDGIGHRCGVKGFHGWWKACSPHTVGYPAAELVVLLWRIVTRLPPQPKWAGLLRAVAMPAAGLLCENTVEAAVKLAERDLREGPLPHFPYLEFDVQETADGELVVFHDALLSDAFPTDGCNAELAEQLVQATGIPFNSLTLQDLSLVQIQSLHLAGRRGLHVPTLKQLLEACVAAGLRRTLAVEVKLIRTDAARQRLIDIVGAYLDAQSPRLNGDPVALRHRCKALGWAGIIAFPHLFAASYGEYGTPEWHLWADKFKQRGIPVRACHALWLPLIGC